MRLILHIGAGKCGSSAIQSYLARNAAALRRNGVLVPDQELGCTGNTTGEHIWFFENALNTGSARSIIPDRLSALKADMSGADFHTAIISAENLINHETFAISCAAAAGLFDDIQVVAYIRRQDDYMISAWCQWWFKIYPSIGAYIQQTLGSEANWERLTRPWEQAFGSPRVSIRLFQRGSLLNDDVVDDFMDIVRIPLDGYARNLERANAALNETLIEVANNNRQIFDSIHDNKFLELAVSLLGEAAFKTYRGSTLLSLHERLKIMSSYDQGNDIIKRKYFPEIPADRGLFTGPSAEDVVTLRVEERNLLRKRLTQELLTKLAMTEGLPPAAIERYRHALSSGDLE